ncbi:Triosephosphate isomerase [hydrothermal vent metagenome]|uniref:triose-phosphate isomerase n=1 Tax=hydrothermal vent metagenome TaxID=652676 RepID=A0A3B0Z9I0_9ZZZZ
MRRAFVAGNWKMNGSRASAAALAESIVAQVKEFDRVDVALCPSYVFLADVKQAMGATKVRLGAQDLSLQSAGAYTGEISAAMLNEYQCGCVIIGHSERRAYHGETNEQVAKKMVVASEAGLLPIVCVGETLEERESGRTETVIAEQLDVLLDTAATLAALQTSVVAYEPVWAIGTGKTATPEQAQQVHQFIRARIAEKNAELAAGIRLLYGGSVKPGNATELFGMSDIDGGLIGGASLQAEDFTSICRSAQA